MEKYYWTILLLDVLTSTDCLAAKIGMSLKQTFFLIPIIVANCEMYAVKYDREIKTVP